MEGFFNKEPDMHNQSNTPAISPLQQRLIDDMNLRHFGHETFRLLPILSATPSLGMPSGWAKSAYGLQLCHQPGS